MDLGTALLNAFVVLAVGTALGYLTNDRFKALRREMDAFRTSVGASIADLHAEIVRLETRLETRLDSGLTRSGRTSPRWLAVGAKRRTEPA